MQTTKCNTHIYTLQIVLQEKIIYGTDNNNDTSKINIILYQYWIPHPIICLSWYDFRSWLFFSNHALKTKYEGTSFLYLPKKFVPES